MLRLSLDFMDTGTPECIQSTWHTITITPVQIWSQDLDGKPAGKCLCGERARLPASADTAYSAAPNRSLRNKLSLNAVVGGETDRGDVCTDEGRVRRCADPTLAGSIRCLHEQFTRLCRLFHELGRHASCAILMPSSWVDFPTLVLHRERVVACIRVCRSPSFGALHGKARKCRRVSTA